MYSIFLGDYDDSDTDWHVVAHNTSDSAAPDSFADPPDFAQSAGFVNESDSEEGYASEALGNSRPGPKPGGYDSRVEQLLYENPNLPILITEAGKGADGTKYIAYTIRTGVSIAFIHCDFSLTDTGFGSSQAILRIRIFERCARQAAPNSDNPPNSRKAYNGRLCCKPHEGKAGPANDRLSEADAGGILEPLPSHGRRP